MSTRATRVLIGEIRTIFLNLFFWMVLILLLAGCTSSLPLLPPPTPQQMASQPEQLIDSPYTLGVEDALQVTIFEHPNLSHEVTISPDGSFTYPLIGEVQAAGLTVPQLEQQMTQRLANGYLIDPKLTITVIQYRSRHVFVMGAVRVAGVYPLKHNATLLELLSQAGGVDPEAGWYALVVRASKTQNRAAPKSASRLESEAVMRIDLEKLLAGEVAQPIGLQSGDTIYVPKIAHFFVTGHVRSPGRYVLERETTVLKAVIMAGDFTEFAAKSRMKVRRLIEGQPLEFRVRMYDRLQAGDVLVVPVTVF